MMLTTIKQYDIRHTGDEMDRLDILAAFGELKRLCEEADQAGVDVSSEKSDLISVTITTVDAP